MSGGSIRLTDDGCDIDRSEANLEECSVVCYYDAYERIGGIVTVKELVSGLLRDKVFYDQSGGGVTFSGGDAGMQAEFFHNVAVELRDREVHVALDTAGYFPWEKLAPLVAAVDLVLYDIKMLSRTLHKRYTGVDNQLILENAMRVADMGKDMTVRLILIPGVNDSDDEIIGRLKFAKSLGRHVKVDLIKYHKLGAGKYASLGMIEMMEGTPECSDDLAEYAANIARNMGLTVTIGG
jgi:pyruvate formate lyase activating enzyme